MDELDEASAFVRENGAADFVPDYPHYEFDRLKGSVLVIAMSDIGPVTRCRLPRFDNVRGRDVLDGFRGRIPLPPIRVIKNDEPCGPHPYKLQDGFHRLYLSIAVGYQSIPVEVVPDNRHLFAGLDVQNFS
ncbi:hypothetical protein ACIOZM_08435 [Pseudomonas sp. NPDC087346]|uniref:hypothetical protein n=1 Tax=Pseudomonas sp. NPDC087346 TaxID=3364438 RepID=UPI0038217930